MKYYDALVFDLNGTLWLDAPTRSLPVGAHPDSEAILTELSLEYPVFIVSNCHPYQMEEYLKTFNNNPFKETVHFGKYGSSKTKNLEELKKIYNFKSPLYIGDSPSDQLAAHRADYHFLWAAYTSENFEPLDGPRIKNLNEIFKFIQLDPKENF